MCQDNFKWIEFFCICPTYHQHLTRIIHFTTASSLDLPNSLKPFLKKHKYFPKGNPKDNFSSLSSVNLSFKKHKLQKNKNNEWKIILIFFSHPLSSREFFSSSCYFVMNKTTQKKRRKKKIKKRRKNKEIGNGWYLLSFIFLFACFYLSADCFDKFFFVLFLFSFLTFSSLCNDIFRLCACM